MVVFVAQLNEFVFGIRPVALSRIHDNSGRLISPKSGSILFLALEKLTLYSDKTVVNPLKRRVILFGTI